MRLGWLVPDTWACKQPAGPALHVGEVLKLPMHL